MRSGIWLSLSTRSTQGSHTGSRCYLPICLYNCGWTALRQGSLDRAIAILDESNEVARELCDDSATLNSTRPGKTADTCYWIRLLRTHTAGILPRGKESFCVPRSSHVRRYASLIGATLFALSFLMPRALFAATLSQSQVPVQLPSETQSSHSASTTSRNMVANAT